MPQPQLRLIVALPRAVVDGAHVQVPAAAAEIAGRLQRDLVAERPPESLGQLGPNDAALAIGEEVRPLPGRDDVLGVHPPPVVGHDDKLWKEILDVLVHAAEPRGLRRVAHPRKALQTREIRDRQRLHDGRPSDHDESIGAGDIDALPEAVMNGAEKPEQEHRHGKGADRQHRPDLAASKVREEQRKELHGWHARAGAGRPAGTGSGRL